MMRRLRFCDLIDRGIVRNRATLSNWIRKSGFPTGQLTGPNSRTWDEGEVTRWLANRPTAQKPVPQSKGRPRKGERMATATMLKILMPPADCGRHRHFHGGGRLSSPDATTTRGLVHLRRL